jgi:hypothetical protein
MARLVEESEELGAP